MTATPQSETSRSSFVDALAVYTKRRVLAVLLLGFSGGLPIVLIGSTLQAWLKTANVDVRTIGLFAAVAVPYNFKFLWAPLVDSLDVPVLSDRLGRRRAWLLLSQVLLIGAIVFLAFCDPAVSPWHVALGALLVATASATQDIVIDAFRVESLDATEQAAGMASYVAGYRVGSLASNTGALLLVVGLQKALPDHAAWTACYLVMATMILIGIAGTLLGDEPRLSAAVEAEHTAARDNSFKRAFWTAVESFRDFLSRHLALAVLAFVVLFKLADALAFSLLTTFTLDIGFSLSQIATLRTPIGFVSTILGGFAGGLIARAYPLATSLWIGIMLQTVMIFAFCVQALVGANVFVLAGTTAIESFFDALGTVIFVAYISALCRNPRYTATQYALLTALAAVGRNIVSLGSGFVAHALGWVWFFVLCAAAALPAFLLLSYLQQRGHFKDLETKPAA